MLMLALALGQELAEIEVARGEKPKAGCLFKKDDDDGTYVLDRTESPKPATSFGSMNRERACAWALEVVRASFEGEWSDLSRPENGPDTLNGKPAGWSLDFLQTYKNVAFYDPDDPGDRAGVLAMLSDDLSGGGGPGSARIRVKRWTVLKEHGPAKKIVKDATPGPLKHFAKAYPGVQGKPEAEAELCWAPKPGAADRRIPIWHVTVSAPNGFKPQLHTYRVDAWTGEIASSREIAIPGRIPSPPPAPPPKK